MSTSAALSRDIERLSRLSRVELRSIRQRAWSVVNNLPEPARRAAYERTRDALAHDLVRSRIRALVGSPSSGE